MLPRDIKKKQSNEGEKETIKVFWWKLNGQQQVPIIILFSWLLHYRKTLRNKAMETNPQQRLHERSERKKFVIRSQNIF